MKNPHFHALLREMAEIHDRKNGDYANSENPYSNFEYAASISRIFTDPVDRVFVTLIAVKLARIAELRKGKVPKNESLLDSFVDLATYTAIWAARHKACTELLPEQLKRMMPTEPFPMHPDQFKNYMVDSRGFLHSPISKRKKGKK